MSTPTPPSDAPSSVTFEGPKDFIEIACGVQVESGGNAGNAGGLVATTTYFNYPGGETFLTFTSLPVDRVSTCGCKCFCRVKHPQSESRQSKRKC
jgi:hypothetical protein